VPVWGTRMATGPGRVYTFGRTGGQAVLGIVDAGAPEAPIWKSSIQVSSNANTVGIQAVGNRVYVHTSRWFSSGQSRLAIVDVTNPVAPNILGTLPTLGGGSLAVVGNYAYVAQNGPSIAVVDISIPSTPALISETPCAGLGEGVAYDNGYLYLATESEGLQIFDLSVPHAPAFVASFPLPWAYEVTVRDHVAYVSGGDVFMIDVSNPVAPSLLSMLAIDGSAGAIRFNGAHAWITTDVDVIVVDMSNPASPRRLGEQAGNGEVYDDLGIINDLVYTCGSDGTIHVLPAQCTVTAVPETPIAPTAARLRVLPPFPNPTTDGAGFIARLPEAGRYKIAIHDISGRLVTDLPSIEAPGPMDASLAWNGRDHDGKAVATGVYFVRVHGRGETATQRLLVTR
ncbi:MAG TPA: T9SS type A sorting domain-containing protein, partial [Candidatus Eisenbacteria bacterium]